MIVYGIKNCNTVKNALDWLKKNNIDFQFHDYKSKGIDGEILRKWCKQVGWDNLINKRGTTWRQLDEEAKSKIVNEPKAIALMSDKTSVIKRPLIEHDGQVVVLGFDAELYSKKF